MKKILVLILGTLLLVSINNALAVEANPVLGIKQKTTIHVEYNYNSYGTLLSSTQETDSVTTTTTENAEGEEVVNTTTTNSVSESTWLGGSLKIQSSAGASASESDDGSNSTTIFSTDYEYDENGRLVGASGTAETKSKTVDAKGETAGTSKTETIDTYVILNGEALRSKSETTGESFGVGGAKTADITETATYKYGVFRGKQELIKEINVSSNDGVDGTSQTTTKTKIYERDANGVCTAITQTAEGTYVAVGQNGGSQTYTITNYEAIFELDEEQGWYLKEEGWDWESGDGSIVESSSDTQAETAVESAAAPESNSTPTDITKASATDITKTTATDTRAQAASGTIASTAATTNNPAPAGGVFFITMPPGSTPVPVPVPVTPRTSNLVNGEAVSIRS